MYTDLLGPHFWNGLQNFVVALIVLLIGWLIAKMIGNAVTKALRKTDLDDKFFDKYRRGEKKADSENIIGKVVYYLLLLFVVIIFFNILNLHMIATPLSGLIETFLGFIPAVLKAALILLLAYALASVVRWLIVTGGSKLNLQPVFRKFHMTKNDAQVHTIIEQIGTVVFYLILLLFIPGVLDALNISGIAQPFSGLLESILAFIPKLLAASIVFAVGWLVARIVKNIVVNLLQAAGAEKLVGKLHLQKMLEGTTLSRLIGNLVFILMMIPITIASLERLDLRGISEPAISMLNQILNMIPNILIGVGLVFLGVWLGKIIGNFVTDFLKRIGFDKLSNKIGVGVKNVDASKMVPSAIVGYIVQVLIVFFLTIQALHLIKLDFLVNIATAITAYLPHVLAAIVVLGVALTLSSVVEKVLNNLLTGSAARFLAGFAKYAILALAVFMALTQLGIAPTIVSSAFILVLGGISLAFGLAFGLGGKEFARKYLQKFDRKIENTSVQQKGSQESENTFDDSSGNQTNSFNPPHQSE